MKINSWKGYALHPWLQCNTEYETGEIPSTPGQITYLKEFCFFKSKEQLFITLRLCNKGKIRVFGNVDTD